MEKVKGRITSFKAWEIPKQKSSCAPKGVRTNIDNDVTPLSRRTWTLYMIIGFWASDYLSIQSYENPSSVISFGLSWDYALMNSIVGIFLIAVPIALNGAMGADLHVPFAISNRASFGYNASYACIVIRLITATFWHGIQSTHQAMYYAIGAIWPSFLTMKNHLPESAGITSAQLIAQFVFFVVQFPIMLIPPHKLRWFFFLKIAIMVGCLLGMVGGLTKMSHGAGELFHQGSTIHGSEKSWTLLYLINSTIGGWATMATNISDFTRYTNAKKSQYYQVVIIPFFAVFVTMMSIISCSAGKTLYGVDIWAPTDFAAHWIPTGSKGRAASFFMCISWCLAQIGTNLSANVISAANDLTTLCPTYLNIRRSAVIVTFTGCWIIVPWKIVYSAGSLISFMGGVSLFLAPIFSIMICDYWIIKKRRIDVPELYNPKGIYSYDYGINWRAVVAFFCSLVPNLPGLANSVNANVSLSEGAQHFASLGYIYGVTSAMTVYYVLNYFFPHTPSLIPEVVYGESFLDSDESESVEQEVISLSGDKQISN